MLKGACDCGAIKFEVNTPVTDFSHCHCSICQRVHGAAFVTWGGIKKEGFRYTQGEDLVRAYSSTEAIERYFCPVCSSSFLCDFRAEPDMLYIAMACFDGDPELPPGYHFFMSSKKPWLDVADELPKWQGWSEGPD